MRVINDYKSVIEEACGLCHKLSGEQPTKVEVLEGGRVLRWESPSIQVDVDRDDKDLPFNIDFEVSTVLSVIDKYQTQYLSAMLYFYGTEVDLSAQAIARTVGPLLNNLNRDEPGVKFRYRTPEPLERGSDNLSWVIIECDFPLTSTPTEKSVTSMIDRLLECAEVRYLEVETYFGSVVEV